MGEKSEQTAGRNTDGKSLSVEQRIRAIEDRLEIYNLIAGHPPSADTGADYYAEAVYVDGSEPSRDILRGALAGYAARA